jgi:sugar lactone lactonase YvrE
MSVVEVAELDAIGHDLNRPECVLTTSSGDLYASDRECGVVRVWPEQPVRHPLHGVPDGFLANGIAVCRDGSFLMANIGGETGGVWRLRPGGVAEPVVTHADGVPMTATNFVFVDQLERVWATICTRLYPRERAFRRGYGDGFIARIDDGVAHIVADNIGFSNEAQVDPSGKWLYANETIARRLSRFPIRSDGSLGARETVAEFGDGSFPDGMAFDAEGGVWVTAVVSNRLIRIGPDGSETLVLDDSDPDVRRRVEEHFAAGAIDRADLDAGRTRPLRNLSSLAFGGPDLHRVFLGSLFNDRVLHFRSEIAGAEPAHWSWNVDGSVFDA